MRNVGAVLLIGFALGPWGAVLAVSCSGGSDAPTGSLASVHKEPYFETAEVVDIDITDDIADTDDIERALIHAKYETRSVRQQAEAMQRDLRAAHPTISQNTD